VFPAGGVVVVVVVLELLDDDDDVDDVVLGVGVTDAPPCGDGVGVAFALALGFDLSAGRLAVSTLAEIEALGTSIVLAAGPGFPAVASLPPPATLPMPNATAKAAAAAPMVMTMLRVCMALLTT
jgi:hypothetical protein